MFLLLNNICDLITRAYQPSQHLTQVSQRPVQRLVLHSSTVNLLACDIAARNAADEATLHLLLKLLQQHDEAAGKTMMSDLGHKYFFTRKTC